MNKSALFFAVLTAVGSNAAVADMPVAGQVYQGPKQFSGAELGLAFALPAGFSGALDSEMFAIFDPSDRGQTGILLLWASKGTVASARELMSQPIPVSSVTLQPKSPVNVRNNVLTATYSIIGGGPLTEATITTRVSHGTIVALIAGFGPATKGKIQQLTGQVGSSLRISKPRVANTAKSSGSGEWYRWLVGARLTRFSSGSGYSEKESYTFCANGTFYRSFGATSVSGNGSGAAHANNSGRWSVSGKGNSGVIVLEFANGSVDRSPVEYRGGKTFWGGTRYFYEANQCR